MKGLPRPTLPVVSTQLISEHNFESALSGSLRLGATVFEAEISPHHDQPAPTEEWRRQGYHRCERRITLSS